MLKYTRILFISIFNSYSVLLALVTARLDDETMKLRQKVHDLVKMVRIDLMELSDSSL